jgi:3-oxoacyl-[acyl-carrier-protein] synthase III
MQRYCHIVGMGSALPARVVSNDELAKTLDTTDEWIVSHTGIRARHIAGPDESTSTLAAHAGKAALERAGVKPEELGTIIVATTTADYLGFPSTACLVQHALGATRAAAFDVSAACTGFVYSLAVARGLLQFDARPVLVIGAETMTRASDWTDRNTCVLFGDGAGAAVLQASDRPGGLLHTILRADGKGAPMLFREGGSRLPPEAMAGKSTCLQMQGKPVFNFAVKAFDEIIRDLVAAAGIGLDDVRWIVPHQANVRIIEAAARRLGIGLERFFVNIDQLANTSAATIPLAFDQMLRENRVQPGDRIIFVGFGAGLTWGGAMVQWNPAAVATA